MSVEDQVEKLEHIIYGNGKPGLAEDVRNLTNNVSKILTDLKDNNEESKIVRRQILIGIVVGVILASFNLVVAMHK